jgi:hypothetical protein
MALSPRTARAIDLAIGEPADGPVFLAAYGRRLDRHGADGIVRKVARRAGIPKARVMAAASMMTASAAAGRCLSVRLASGAAYRPHLSVSC